MALSRRKFLTLAGTSAAGAMLMSPLQALFARVAQGQPFMGGGFGPLQPDPNGLLDLPPGFQYRAFSRTGDIMSDGNPVPGDHDGMAAFPGPRGTTILVRNHELSPDETDEFGVAAPEDMKFDPVGLGGTTTLIVAPNRQLIQHYGSLAGTYRNCSGGPTPWGSWVSCEENTSTPAGNSPGDPNNVTVKHGYNFEVPSRGGMAPPVPLVAMGRFNHEAIAVDPRTGIVYETEDRSEGLFYRFVPNVPGNLAEGGVLQALAIVGMPQAITKTGFPVGQQMAVEWIAIEDVDPPEDTVRDEGFAKGAAQFTRGEGLAYGNGQIYFCCTDGGVAELGQVWCYLPDVSGQTGGTIQLFVEPNDQSVLDGPDNIEVAPFGDLILCEDGDGEQFLVGVNPQGQLYKLARNAINDREFAGATFSPDGQTLFVNIQDPGITFAIWGPWNRRA
jgi:secreted PhoX family phosphatase